MLSPGVYSVTSSGPRRTNPRQWILTDFSACLCVCVSSSAVPAVSSNANNHNKHQVCFQGLPFRSPATIGHHWLKTNSLCFLARHGHHSCNMRVRLQWRKVVPRGSFAEGLRVKATIETTEAQNQPHCGCGSKGKKHMPTGLTKTCPRTQRRTLRKLGGRVRGRLRVRHIG